MCLKDIFGSSYVLVVVYMVYIATGYAQSSTDVLWKSCEILVCGKPRLDIQCDTSSKILINNVTSSHGNVRTNANSYSNLRRTCMGLSTCHTIYFCNQYQANSPYFHVSYTCVKDKDVDKTCIEDGQLITIKSGFISSLNYPSETKFRKCRWIIQVKPGHLIHIFLHEVHPISNVSPDRCSGGLLFKTNDTCGQHFPTEPICNEIGKATTMTACSNVEILLSGNSESESMRFWISFYVVQRNHQTHFSQLQHFALYDVDITCKVNAKENFVYKYNQISFVTDISDSSKDIDVIQNVTTIVQPSYEYDANVDYVTFIGLAVGLLVLSVIIITIGLLVRFRLTNRSSDSKETLDTQRNLSKSFSLNSDAPLPETGDVKESVMESEPELQQEYSSVVDMLQQPMLPPSSISHTYAEIEECSETGEMPRMFLVSKKSTDNSKRELPAKPIENAKIPIYYDIKEYNAKDEKTQKPKDDSSKHPQDEEKNYNNYSYKKKFSNASNVYDECADVGSNGHDVSYIDMSHKHYENSEFVTNKDISKVLPHSKTSKNEANISKKSHVVGKITNNYILDTEGIKVKGEALNERTSKCANARKLKVKIDSVTNKSDSDDEICMIENDLYEPFESAKV